MERNFDRASAEQESADPSPPGSRVPAPHFVFSTHEIPAKGKFEIWRDFWGTFGEVKVSSHTPEILEGGIELWHAGPLTAVDLSVNQSHYERTKAHARNGHDDFSLTLCGSGTIVDSTVGGTVALPRGGAFFLSHDHRYTITPAENCPTRILRVERAALIELMPRDFEIMMQTFAPGHRTLRLVENIASLFASKTEPTTHERRETIARQAVDLIALLLRPSRDGRALIEQRGLKAAQLGAVLNSIDRHFAQFSLSAETVGRSLGISDRQVHRLLAETTKTFYEHLLERRLLRAREMLIDPLHGETSIAEIAFRTGFTNVSFFSKNFRRRFGDTPTGVRSTAVTERSLSLLRDSLRTR
jgi:AraC-like DNA-binding protein